MDWKELGTNDKADLISLFVKNGITDLNQMRKLYANGGYIRSYSDWKKKIKEHKGLDIDSDNTYDYQGFYNENPERAYKLLEESPNAHFTDKYKTPTHPTFSDESIYSNDKTKGGHWIDYDNNIEFRHSDYTAEHLGETNRYLQENDKNAFATYKGGVVLNPAIVTANRYANGGDKATLNNPRYNKGAEDRIYAYLRDEGLSHNQASAFMGNIAVESLLNADINQENNGPAKGLLQTESDRYKKLQQYNEVPYKFGTGLTPDEQHQLDYFINKGVKTYISGEWGREGYNGKKYKSARDARKDFNNPNRSAQELSDILMNSYFRPGKPQEWRRDKMTDYYDKEMPTRFPYIMDEWGQHYYDKELNRYDTGGPLKSDTTNTFLTDWYSSPTTQSMIHQIEEQNGLPQSDVNIEVQTALETPQYEIHPNSINDSVPLDVLRGAATLGRSYYQTPENAVNQFRQASQKEREVMQRINLSNVFNGIPDFGAIYTKMNGNPFILYKEGMFNPSNSLHELDHNIQQLIPATLDTVIPIEHRLNSGIKPDYYLDSPNEIRSRIMQLRQINNLSPEKRDYNKKDAKKFIGKVKDKQLKKDLERMDYQTVADYLNYMADNSTYTFNPYLT